jgi:uncharacterized protein YndB with AHSA1/START domain
MKLWLAGIVALVSAVASAQDASNAVSFVNEGTLNAPIADVWKVWSTSEGYKAVGVALADVDLRVGGLIRSRYAADGALGDELTIENEILAFEPPRMIAFRIHKTPSNFPFKEAWKHTWTVVTLTALPDGRTQLRAASLGFGSDPESTAMRRFFERGNAQTMETLAAHFDRSAR